MLIPKYFVLNNLHTYMCILFVQDYKMVNFSLSDMDVDDCDQISVGQVFSLTTNSWQEVEAGKLKDIWRFVEVLMISLLMDQSFGFTNL